MRLVRPTEMDRPEDEHVMEAECLVVDARRQQRHVTLRTHAACRSVLGGDVVVAFYISSNAAVLMLKHQAETLPRNSVAEEAHAHYVGGRMVIRGPVLFVGLNPTTEEIETLPGEWRKPLTEWGERRC